MITYKLVVYRNSINGEEVYTLEDPVFKDIDGVRFIQGINDMNNPRLQWFKFDALEKIGVQEWKQNS